MHLRVVGAGLPRTGTSSLKVALGQLLGGACCHMSTITGHPFDLGAGWQEAIAGRSADWDQILSGYVAAVDWPASMFWRELSEANPEALVLLSVRENAEVWWESLSQTVLPVSRWALAPGWSDGKDILRLLERFAGTPAWDDRLTLQAAYERHNDEVRQSVDPGRLLEWRASEGWEPICKALDLPIPETPFPWKSPRSEWQN